MYTLKDLGRGEWQMVSKCESYPFSFTGSLSQVFKHSMIGLCIPVEELNHAIEAMKVMDHDTAHFGIMRSFIFSDFDKKKVH